MDHNRQFPTNNFDFDEDDDISDSLSPSDGYFSQSSQVPPNLLVVDDPESEAASSAKAQEAAQDSPPQRYRDITPPDSPQFRRGEVIYTPSSSSRDSDDDPTLGEHQEERALLEHDPPPQYEARRSDPPAETSPLSTRNSPGYNTMNYVRTPIPFSSNSNQPISMRDDHGDMYDAEEASHRPARRGWFDRNTTGGRFRRFLVQILLISLAIWLIVIVFKAKQKSQDPPSEHSTEPVTPADPPALSPPEISPTISSLPTQSPVTSTIPAPPPWSPSPTGDPEYRLEGTTIIHTSKSISGQFELHDFLYMRTTSGSISITIIIPEHWHSSSPESVIDIATVSGSIHIEFLDHNGLAIDDSEPLSSITSTPRILTTTYQSTGSGSISGKFLHGNSTRFSTKSGSITGTVFASSRSSSPSHLSSESKSGSQALILKSLYPYKYFYPTDGSSFPPIYGTHRAHGSASITLYYSHLWAGTLDMWTTGSGSVTASGEGLHVSKETKRHLHAHRRGDGEHEQSKVLVESFGSGSLLFEC